MWQGRVGRRNSLSGDALVKALEAETWDPSVKSLVPFPVVLATMNSNLTWLQQLSYAFATQQADVFAAVQRLRRLAQENDKLQWSPQQVASTQQVLVEPPPGSNQAPTQQDAIVIASRCRCGRCGCRNCRDYGGCADAGRLGLRLSRTRSFRPTLKNIVAFSGRTHR